MNKNNPQILGILGIVAAITAVAQCIFDGDPATNPDWALVASAFVAGLGNFFSRQSNKTSEEAGAK